MTNENLHSRVHQQAVDLLKRLGSQRKWLHRAIIGGGGLIIAIGEIGVNFAPDEAKPYLGMLWIIGVLAVFAGLFLEPEQSAAEMIAASHEASQRITELEHDVQDAELFCEALEDEIDSASALYETHRALMQTVQAMLSQGFTEDEIPASCARLLDILVQRRATLCAMGEEKWNFAVYLYDTATNDLACVVCRRWSRESEDQEHRRWPSGAGHTGNAFKLRKELVCADANDPSVSGLIRGHSSEQRDYDSSVYVSIASIPITASPDAQPFGVIVATSDEVGRFRPESGDDRDTVEPLRALANALETLLTAYNLIQSGLGDSNRK